MLPRSRLVGDPASRTGRAAHPHQASAPFERRKCFARAPCKAVRLRQRGSVGGESDHDLPGA
jgi:hypothetical protein